MKFFRDKDHDTGQKMNLHKEKRKGVAEKEQIKVKYNLFFLLFSFS